MSSFLLSSTGNRCSSTRPRGVLLPRAYLFDLCHLETLSTDVPRPALDVDDLITESRYFHLDTRAYFKCEVTEVNVSREISRVPENALRRRTPRYRCLVSLYPWITRRGCSRLILNAGSPFAGFSGEPAIGAESPFPRCSISRIGQRACVSG